MVGETTSAADEATGYLGAVRRQLCYKDPQPDDVILPDSPDWTSVRCAALPDFEPVFRADRM
jgi:hypothetical protein